MQSLNATWHLQDKAAIRRLLRLVGECRDTLDQLSPSIDTGLWIATETHDATLRDLPQRLNEALRELGPLVKEER